MMRLTGPRQGVSLIKILLLVAGLLLVCGGGFFAWSKLSGDEGDSGQEAAESQPADTGEQEETKPATETLSLGEFLVNLRSSDGTLRYLQTEISIVTVSEHADPAEDAGGHGGGDAEEETALPPASHRYARDVAIEVLSSQSFEGLRDQTDRSKLKAILQQKLDAALESHEVRDVLFTAFVMQ